METWCVEVDLSAHPEGTNPADTGFWIVTRSAEDSPWSAAMVLTMSTPWPYPACEHSP
jgi:hypothetical protein